MSHGSRNVNRAQITSPPVGSLLASSTVTFTLTAGAGAQQYWLSVGSTPGGTQIYNASQGTDLSRTVSGLPTVGSAVHARLWSLLGTYWVANDYSYVAAGGDGGQPFDQRRLQGGGQHRRNQALPVHARPGVPANGDGQLHRGPGTALPGVDYVRSSGVLTFNPGETIKKVRVLVIDDRLREPTETFFVNLRAAFKATIADGEGKGSILNDDGLSPR